MIDRIYLPVRCPACSKMSVTSLPIEEAHGALDRDRMVVLQCAFDNSQWPATSADRQRLQRLLDEHAIVANLPWFHLSASPPNQPLYP